MKKVCVLLAGIFLIAEASLAQMPETAIPPLPPPGGPAGGMVFFQGGAEPNGKVFASSYNYVYTTNIGDRDIVKGAPYSATAVTESTQALADGNRIVNKSSTFMARDSEGRTRREMPKGLGPLPVDLPQMVMISDPVSNTDYMLNLKEKTADIIKRVDGKAASIQQVRKIEMGRQEIEPGIRAQTGAFHVESGGEVRHSQLGSGGGLKHVEVGGPAKHEDLGTQVIEGVSCTGTRETRTIPAGAIGNERPLDTVSETWTSPDLHAIVLSKHSDPRFGETVYRLTDIQRNEPDPALFQVPSDFKVLRPNEVSLPK